MIIVMHLKTFLSYGPLDLFNTLKIYYRHIENVYEEAQYISFQAN